MNKKGREQKEPDVTHRFLFQRRKREERQLHPTTVSSEDMFQSDREPHRLLIINPHEREPGFLQSFYFTTPTPIPISGDIKLIRLVEKRKWAMTLITLNTVGSTSRPQAKSKAFIRRRGERRMGVSIGNKHSTTRQKQEGVLTVMPIDRSALHTVRETSWPIRFVWRQTWCNCKELQTAEKDSMGQQDICSLNTFCSVAHGQDMAEDMSDVPGVVCLDEIMQKCFRLGLSHGAFTPAHYGRKAVLPWTFYFSGAVGQKAITLTAVKNKSFEVDRVLILAATLRRTALM
ncbi:hypothetical protein ABVT39_012240 [Epinephelus coioides]